MNRKKIVIYILLILSIMLGVLSYIKSLGADYYTVEKVESLELYDGSGKVKDIYNHSFYKALPGRDTVYFIGDSITCGSENGIHPWYEPIKSFIDSDIREIAYSGWTSRHMAYYLRTDGFKQFSINKDENVLFVITLGTNDVIAHYPEACAMDPETYVYVMDSLIITIKNVYPNADFVVISPWRSFGQIQGLDETYEEHTQRFDEYSEALEEYCKQEGLIYIDPNGYIKKHLIPGFHEYYLLDELHPNSRNGVELYCEAVLKYE